MADQPTEVILGVDTHADIHVAALLDHLGRLQGRLTIAATRAGSQQLLGWARAHGRLLRAGVEGTGTYGAGLTRHLTQAGVQVIEVDRPNRQRRRRRGKSDPTDAEAAARAVLAGEATATPKTRSGVVESIRVLRVARTGAVKARTQAANQLRDLLVTAPEELRAELYPLPTARRVAALTAQHPGHGADPHTATRRALWHLARRYQSLTAELDALNDDLAALTRQAAPRLLARYGVGVETAGKLLVTAGDNPDRAPFGCRPGRVVRRQPGGGVLGQDRPAPPQPRRGPPGQQRPVGHRHDPAARRSPHPRLCRAAHHPGQDPQRHPALPQALHRPRAVPLGQGRPPARQRARLDIGASIPPLDG